MPHKIVVMGVSGCGKSTLAAALARALACPLIEGDDHHLPASRAKMQSGIALEDADREPWLDALAALLAEAPVGAVLTCSALKRAYRERLRRQVAGLRFVYLAIDAADARTRVAARPAHFFPASVVASQFEALEPPDGEPGVICLDARRPVPALCAEVLAWLDAPA
ncbi:MAG TPA: gluconokinase, GntK/IdnK-type [Burkholderiaceae bacterium]|nr:gluconokinase, GntK/IdnK-type [Burkholderiaceae bacterium]